MISLQAPAKINLSFEVLGRRADGYHEVRTVLAAVDIVDELELTEADALTLTVEPEGAAPVEDNLVLRAALLLREAAAPGAGAAMVLRKRIPLAAGLGGGSSDAAAALLGVGWVCVVRSRVAGVVLGCVMRLVWPPVRFALGRPLALSPLLAARRRPPRRLTALPDCAA